MSSFYCQGFLLQVANDQGFAILGSHFLEDRLFLKRDAFDCGGTYLYCKFLALAPIMYKEGLECQALT